jgi:hypothetical protein
MTLVSRSKENSTKYLDQVLAPTVKRNIPFATTYGNVCAHPKLNPTTFSTDNTLYAAR